MLRRHGLWSRLEPGVVNRENIHPTIQFSITSKTDACITAWSLVKDKGGILLPQSEYPPIRQVGAVVAGSRRRGDAARILEWLTGADGRRLLTRYGFGSP
jgi:molybdate transport system substrate-binding protein